MLSLIIIDIILGVIAFLGKSVISWPFKLLATLLNGLPGSLGTKLLAITVESKLFTTIFTIMKIPFFCLTALIIILLVLKLIKKFIAMRRRKKQAKRQETVSTDSSIETNSMNVF